MRLAERDYMRSQGPDDPYHRALRQQQRALHPQQKHWTLPRSLIIGAFAFFGLFVLPRLTIDGRHWSLWLI